MDIGQKVNYGTVIKTLLVIVFLPFVTVWYVWQKTNWPIRNKWIATAGIAIFCLFAFASGGEKPATNDSQPERKPATAQVEKPHQEALSQSGQSSEAPVTNQATEVIPEANSEVFPVSRVVDGDTLTVEMNGKQEVLRLIGINTPETVDPRKPVECFGKEASTEAKEILTGKKVHLESDSSQGERDKYNRLLRYVFLEDGTNFNKLMIEAGYAYEYTYNTPYKYQKEFKEAQKKAEGNKRGLWADGTCGGQLNKPNTQPTPVAPTSSQDNVVQNKVSPPVTTGSTNAYVCNCSKTCAQMSSCAEAQYQLNTCGCSKRDADHDGVACDSDCQ